MWYIKCSSLANREFTKYWMGEIYIIISHIYFAPLMLKKSFKMFITEIFFRTRRMQSPWKLILNLPLVNFQIYHNMLLPLWTLYTLTSVCIFSILFFIHFLRCWQGEFVYQSKASFVCDHFLYSCEFNVRLRGDIGRNEMLVTLTV